MVKISLLGLSVLPLRRTLAEMTRAVRPLLLFVAVIVVITYTIIMFTGAKVRNILELLTNSPHLFYITQVPHVLNLLILGSLRSKFQENLFSIIDDSY